MCNRLMTLNLGNPMQCPYPVLDPNIVIETTPCKYDFLEFSLIMIMLAMVTLPLVTWYRGSARHDPFFVK